MGDLTQQLDRAIKGDPQSKNELFASLYQDLRRLAHSRIKRAGNLPMLDTTGLVHESYLRSLNAGELRAQDRGRFLAYAARVMRSVIVDTIRQGRAARHGGAQVRVTLNTDVENSVVSAQDEVVRISEALEVLAKTDERLVRLVEMKYFAGLSERDIAESLDISERTLRRDWQKARLLLLAVLK